MARYSNTRYDWHKAAVSSYNHPPFLPQGQGLERMARPIKATSTRQGLEKQQANIQAKLLVAKTAERHAKENKPSKIGKAN